MITAHHAGYVLDASVIVKWFLHHQEEDRDKALALRDLHVGGRTKIHIPRLALLEVLNAIRFNSKAGEEDGDTAIETLQNLQLEINSGDINVLRKTNAIAWTYKITIYDALYVALAEQVGYPLITADEKMMNKLKGHSIVVPLRELDIKADEIKN